MPVGFRQMGNMTLFEEALLTKMRVHRGYEQATIALMWQRSQGSVSKYLAKWMPRWGAAGETLSLLDITPAYLVHSYPHAYKEAGMDKVCALVDGKDFMTFTPRSNTILTRAAWSNKVEHSAVRVVSWTSPKGLHFEHTDLFLAKVSESTLVSLWGPRLLKCPSGWDMLVDRGFAGTATYYPNLNQQRSPSFLDGRVAFSADEVKADYEICKLRYTCEVAFARVTNEAALRDVIPYDYFPHLDYMNHWAHGAANLLKPLKM